MALHFVFFIIIYYQPNENLQSSFGNGQVILLENMADQPTKNSTSNKGMAFDQSGIDPTPQQNYRQLVTLHLLTKVKNSRSTGKAIIHLNILEIGIATYVKIELLEGPESYQTWLKRQVLNANPFPVIPKNLGVGNIILTIQLSNTTDM